MNTFKLVFAIFIAFVTSLVSMSARADEGKTRGGYTFRSITAEEARRLGYEIPTDKKDRVMYLVGRNNPQIQELIDLHKGEFERQNPGVPFDYDRFQNENPGSTIARCRDRGRDTATPKRRDTSVWTGCAQKVLVPVPGTIIFVPVTGKPTPGEVYGSVQKPEPREAIKAFQALWCREYNLSQVDCDKKFAAAFAPPSSDNSSVGSIDTQQAAFLTSYVANHIVPLTRTAMAAEIRTSAYKREAILFKVAIFVAMAVFFGLGILVAWQFIMLPKIRRLEAQLRQAQTADPPSPHIQVSYATDPKTLDFSKIVDCVIAKWDQVALGQLHEIVTTLDKRARNFGRRLFFVEYESPAPPVVLDSTLLERFQGLVDEMHRTSEPVDPQELVFLASTPLQTIMDSVVGSFCASRGLRKEFEDQATALTALLSKLLHGGVPIKNPRLAGSILEPAEDTAIALSQLVKETTLSFLASRPGERAARLSPSSTNGAAAVHSAEAPEEDAMGPVSSPSAPPPPMHMLDMVKTLSSGEETARVSVSEASPNGQVSRRTLRPPSMVVGGAFPGHNSATGVREKQAPDQRGKVGRSARGRHR